MLCIHVTVWGANDTIKVDNLYYLLKSNKSEVYIVTPPTGKPLYKDELVGYISIPAKIKVENVEDSIPVKEIRSSVFKDCAKITSVTINATLAEIKSYCFYGCTGLTSFNIPSGVTTIGDYAFYGCNNLETVDIPTGVTTIGVHSFRECSKLESVNIPEGVTLIKGNAFANCSGLTTLTLPASITSIQGDVFSNCTSLTTVNIASIKDFCEITFDKDNSNPLYNGKAALYVNSEKITNLVIPAEITEIKEYAFNGYTSLTSVKVHLGVTKIGDDAFKGCTGLTKAIFASISHLCSITFSESNYNNPEYSNPLFYATNLYIGASSTPTTELEIPTDVTSIGQAAFAGAKNITKVEFPSSLNTIGRRAFLNCTGLLIANYSSMDQVTGIDYHGNAEANPLTYAPVLWINGAPTDAIELTESVDGSQFNKCTWLKHVTVKAGNEGNVKYIGKNAFRGCTSLQDINIASCAIDSIHEGALQGCSALKIIQLPTTLKFIGKTAFYGCTQLPVVTIPNSVTTIGDQAFRDCQKIEQIAIPSSATQLGTGIFMYCSKLEKATIESAITELPNATFEFCYGLTDVTLPSSITTIGSNAFHACRSLEDFPSSGTGVKFINSNAFNGCLGFKSLHLHEPIQYIDESAFESCDSLVDLTIPTSVDYISDRAFKQSNNIISLKNVYCYKTTAPKASSGAFGGKENTMTLYIPKGETKDYGKSPWSNFIPASEKIGEDVNLYFYINDVKADSITRAPGSAINATEIPKPELSGRQSFSGWHKAIPGTMPAESKDFYGYIAETTTINGLTYLLEPKEVKKQNGKKDRATVLAPFYGIVGILLGKILSVFFIAMFWKPYFLFSKGLHKSVTVYWRGRLPYYFIFAVFTAFTLTIRSVIVEPNANSLLHLVH